MLLKGPKYFELKVIDQLVFSPVKISLICLLKILRYFVHSSLKLYICIYQTQKDVPLFFRNKIFFCIKNRNAVNIFY